MYVHLHTGSLDRPSLVVFLHKGGGVFGVREEALTRRAEHSANRKAELHSGLLKSGKILICTV